jgi:hypothetical protein
LRFRYDLTDDGETLPTWAVTAAHTSRSAASPPNVDR